MANTETNDGVKSPKDISRLIRDLMDNRDVDQNYSELIELKALLSVTDARQLETVVDQMNVNQFCVDLNTVDDNHPHMDLVVNIFDLVFGTLTPQYTLQAFHSQLVAGFDARSDRVVELWLKTCHRCLEHELALNHPLCPDLDVDLLLHKVIQLMARPSTLIAKYCHSIVITIAKSSALADKFFANDVQQLLVSTKGTDGVVRMRVYELLVSIANTSHKTFYRIEAFGHLKDLLEDFKSDSLADPLLTLNILQLMTDLGATSFGTQYLQSSDNLKTIAQRLNNTSDDIFGNLLLPGYIKIFANLAANEPSILESFPIVMSKLKNMLTDDDLSLRLVAVDAIAAICYKNSGKIRVDSDAEVSAIFMRCLTILAKSSAVDYKERALGAIGHVLRVNEPDVNHEVSINFCEKWFKQFSPEEQRVSVLLRLSREPFTAVRLAALECVRVLASHVWGQRLLASTSGFLDYITERSTETSKEGKDAKFAIIKELVRSPVITETFTKEAVIQLRGFYNDGPYYVANETAVAFEAQ